MGDQEACGSFAPQVFRKNLCQTCFQPQDAHGKAPGLCGRTSLLLPSCPTAAKPAGGPGTDAAAAAKKAREAEEDRRAAEARAETAKRLGWWLLSINAALTRLHPML